MYSYYLVIVLAPLSAAIIAGLFGRQIGRTASHVITIAERCLSMLGDVTAAV
jgi:NADH-quinone oxidoreductase subunit L